MRETDRARRSHSGVNPPVDLSDIDLKPRDITEGEWTSCPPGVRVRLVRNRQYELDLTPEQYQALYRLPYWMLYGPEHGLPKDWFNPDGFLLPKYRPGGGRFDDFRKWRRWHRSHRWLHYRIEEKLRLLRQRYEGKVYWTFAILFVVTSYISIFAAIAGGNSPFAVFGILYVSIFVGMILLTVISNLALRAVVRRRVMRRWAERTTELA
jgi:hypothetical protein